MSKDALKPEAATYEDAKVFNKKFFEYLRSKSGDLSLNSGGYKQYISQVFTSMYYHVSDPAGERYTILEDRTIKEVKPQNKRTREDLLVLNMSGDPDNWANWANTDPMEQFFKQWPNGPQHCYTYLVELTDKVHDNAIRNAEDNVLYSLLASAARATGQTKDHPSTGYVLGYHTYIEGSDDNINSVAQEIESRLSIEGLNEVKKKLHTELYTGTHHVVNEEFLGYSVRAGWNIHSLTTQLTALFHLAANKSRLDFYKEALDAFIRKQEKFGTVSEKERPSITDYEDPEYQEMFDALGYAAVKGFLAITPNTDGPTGSAVGDLSDADADADADAEGVEDAFAAFTIHCGAGGVDDPTDTLGATPGPNPDVDL